MEESWGILEPVRGMPVRCETLAIVEKDCIASTLMRSRKIRFFGEPFHKLVYGLSKKSSIERIGWE